MLPDKFPSRLLACLVVAAGFGCALALAWPGQMEFDSLQQLIEGRSGVYSNWHPPIMSWLLGAGDALLPGPGLFVAANMAVGFGALLAVTALGRASWRLVAGALVCVILPQFLVYQGIVWKDVLFANACVAGFAAIALSAQRGRVWLAVAALFITVAALTRQNGALVVPLAALTLGFTRKSAKQNVAFFLCVAVAALGINAALQTRASQAGGVKQEIMDLQLYDLAGMATRLPGLRFDILEREAPGIARQMPQAVARYTPASHDPIADELPQLRLDGLQQLGPIARQWRAMMVAHPAAYLAMRARVFGDLLLTYRPDLYPAYTVGVDGPDALLRQARFAPRMNARDQMLDRYATALLGTPIFSHLFWAVLSGVCLVILLLRRRGPDMALAGLLVTALVYGASYFFIAIDCEYRYLYVVDLAAILAAFYLLCVRAPARPA
jgi:hypothetical protein